MILLALVIGLGTGLWAGLYWGGRRAVSRISAKSRRDLMHRADLD